MSRRIWHWRRALGIVGICSAISFCLLALGHTIRQSDRFGLKKIEVEGDGGVSAEAVRRLSGLELDTNLFRLDLTAAQAQVETHPMVRRAAVRRRLPHSVRIHVESWVPAFVVALGRSYVADASGHVIKALEPHDDMSLPLVTGIGRQEVQGQRLPRLAGLASLAEAWSEAGLPQLSEIHAPVDGPIALRTREGWEAVLADRGELSELAEVVEEAQRKGKIERVRVDGGRRAGRITVAWEGNDG